MTITEINNSGTYRKYSIKGTILGDNQVYLKLTLATRTNNYNPYVSNLVIDYITPPVAINSYIPVIKDASGDVVEGLVPGGSVSITAVITAYNPLTLIAALYDGNKFIKLGTDYRIVANPSDLNMNVTIDTIPLDVQNPHIKVFLWDNFNSIMPISGWDVKTLQ